MSGTAVESIHILCVDDDPDFVDLNARLLDREDERFVVETETCPQAVMPRLAEGDIDCIVSDYEMPSLDGVELLEQVRSKRPDLPFILFTGKGSEEIAAEAISKGVTEYLQKQSGSEQYTVLANRIENCVEHYRAKEEADRTRRFLDKLLQRATDMIAVVSETGEVKFASGSVKRIIGYTPDELQELGAFALIHENDRERVKERFEQQVNQSDGPTSIQYCAVHKNGETIRCRSRGYDLMDDPDVNGIVIYTRKQGLAIDSNA